MSLPADANLLDRNLRALGRHSPRVANAVRAAGGHAGAVFTMTEDGVPTCRVEVAGIGRSLGSARHPLREAERLAEQADPSRAAIFAVLGFGLGYHVDAMAQRVRGAGLILCYEPDVDLLRSVLKRVDCTAAFETGRVMLVHEAGSSDAISARLRGLEGVLALGVRFIAHPPSAARLGASAEVFSKKLVEVISAAKTSIVTTLVQTEKTLENTLRNAHAYAGHPGLDDLAGAIEGVPAIVVSAGPSLAESIDVLARPGVRERACIIAAQTVLKPLLQRGVRPHFVTALDYHDISKRFYEGLTTEMVEGVTLVAEPKANPAILEAWPGAMRLAGDEVLDRVLGDASHAHIRGGATVAHLSYFLARHLGCDPVILVGQDLAYTDGLYYGAGAAIHHVWAAELGEFRTLEMMEAERIGRARAMLRQAVGQDGQPVVTDEQLHNYLLQFEREFAEDAGKGLTVIDAGRGAVKAHTVVRPLAEALDQYGRAFALPGLAGRERQASVAERLEAVAGQADELAELTRRAGDMVRSLDAFGDAASMNESVLEIHKIRDRAQALDPAYWLTQFLNQTGGLRRAKRDRAIAISAEEASEREVQAQRIERDAENLEWIAESADRMASLLRAAASGEGSDAAVAEPDAVEGALPAVVWFDPERGGLGQARDLMAPVLDGLTAADLTLRALARCRRVSRVVLVATDVGAATEIAERAPSELDVCVRAASGDSAARRRAIGAARAFTPSSFRGGLASLTPHDEAFDPEATLAIMDEVGSEGVLVLGADWALLDAVLTDRVAERLLMDVRARHVAFAQAPAGLAACALARPAVVEIAGNPAAGPLATIGGLLAYTPHLPRPDPIARNVCVTVEPRLRDLGRRLIPDSADRRITLRPLLEMAASGGVPVEVFCALAERALQRPTHLAAVLGEAPDDELRQRVLAFARGAADTAITLECDQCGYTEWVDSLVRELRAESSAAVHVRTPLAWGEEEIERLCGGPVDVISVDVADPTFPPPLEAFEELVGRKLRTPWIVPRLRRNEAMLPTLLRQYDQALLAFGAAVIEADPSEAFTRLAALPLPEGARGRLEREQRRTRAATAVSLDRSA
jgi:hypothetical protein